MAGKRNFLLGVAVALFFGGVAVRGLYPQLRTVVLTRILTVHGFTAIGTIIDKKDIVPP